MSEILHFALLEGKVNAGVSPYCVLIFVFSEKIKSGECTKADLCYSLQETIFAMLVLCRSSPGLHRCWGGSSFCRFLRVLFTRWKLRSVRWLTVDNRRCLSLAASDVRSKCFPVFTYVPGLAAQGQWR